MKLVYLCIIFLIFPIKSWACSFSVSPINFGEYNPIFNNDALSSGNIRISGCLLTLLIGFKFTSGNGTYAQRFLWKTDNTDKLNYNIYLDSSRQNIWGDGTQGTTYYNSLISIPLGGSYNVPVYGLMHKRQNVSAGSYNDNIQVTISF